MSKKTEYYINTKIEDSNILTNQIQNVLDVEDPIYFHQSLKHYLPTPVILLKNLANKLNIKELWLKDESRRFNLLSFKALGASYVIYKFLKKNSGTFTFCTATDGNHGRAVAWAARLFNQQAIIFVPEYTTDSRIQSIKDEGARVIVFKGNYDDTVKTAVEQSNQNGYILIQDTSWEGYTDIPAQISAGYSTIFKELENIINKSAGPVTDIVIIQVGVGSFASSAVNYYRNKYKNRCPFIICVEPFEADGLIYSIKQNKILSSIKSQNTIMAGLNCGTPSLIAWPILKNGVDVFISISDEYTIEAMSLLNFPTLNDIKINSGESGAAGLGALLAILSDPDLTAVKERIGINQNSRILIFNTEGITDPVLFKKLFNKNSI